MSRKTPVRVIRSGLTGTVYALTRYRQREDGLITVIGEGKHDVTKDVELLVAERCAPLVEALKVIRWSITMPQKQAREIADAALGAYRAAQGAGRELRYCPVCHKDHAYAPGEPPCEAYYEKEQT